MQTRLEKLEINIQTIQTDLAVIKASYATKADLGAIKADISDAKTRIILWVVSAVFMAQLLPLLIRSLPL